MKIKLTGEQLNLLRNAPSLPEYVLANYTGNRLKATLQAYNLSLVDARSTPSVYAAHARAFEAHQPAKEVRARFAHQAQRDDVTQDIQVNDTLKMIMRGFYENHEELIMRYGDLPLDQLINYNVAEHWSPEKLAPYGQPEAPPARLSAHIKRNYLGRDIASAQAPTGSYLGSSVEIYKCFQDDIENEAKKLHYSASEVARMNEFLKVLLVHTAVVKRLYAAEKEKILAQPFQPLAPGKEFKLEREGRY